MAELGTDVDPIPRDAPSGVSEDRGSVLRDAFFRDVGDSAQFLELFDHLPTVYLYVKDAAGHFVAINRTQVLAKGMSDQSEIWGKTDLDIHPLYWGRQYQSEDREVIRSGRPLPGRVWLVPTAGRELGTFISSKIPIRDAAGGVIGIAGVMYRIDRSQAPGVTPAVDPVDAATAIFAKQFDTPIRVADVAARVGLSTSQLNRRFREKIQMTPRQYLQRVRVFEASRLLVETDRRITDIAIDCGFYDAAHLSRTFGRWMNQSPKQFRNQ